MALPPGRCPCTFSWRH